MQGTVYPTGNLIEIHLDNENLYSVISKSELNRVLGNTLTLDPGPPNIPVVINFRKQINFLGFYRVHFVLRDIYFDEVCAVIESQTPGLFLNKIPERLGRFLCTRCKVHL
jgi:hypothetical protein